MNQSSFMLSNRARTRMFSRYDMCPFTTLVQSWFTTRCPGTSSIWWIPIGSIWGLQILSKYFKAPSLSECRFTMFRGTFDIFRICSYYFLSAAPPIKYTLFTISKQFFCAILFKIFFTSSVPREKATKFMK